MKFGILDYLTESSIEQAVIGTVGKVSCYQCRYVNELPSDISELTAVMAWHYLKIDSQTIDRLSSCRVIVRVGVGIDNVDVEYAGKVGIPVVHIPDYGTNDVADHAFGLLLTIARKIHYYNENIQNNPVQGWNPNISLPVFRLTGKVIGIIGFGRIGMSMAARAKAFGMNVVFYDPYKADGYDKMLQIKRVETLDELIPQVDVLSIHAPLTSETRGMISKDILAKAKRGFTLINTARGEIVSLDAVYESMQKGDMMHFAADVLEQEPPAHDHPLLKAYHDKEPWLDGRVVLTPHAGFYAEETRREMRQKAAIQMLHAGIGQPLTNCVNEKWLLNSRAIIDMKRVSIPVKSDDKEYSHEVGSIPN
ncbi:C-terminal binding protein [Paenibacillus melissococcoides]|uniref:C-terminal binding protein n=1 Tax=Paenibacillus melissococcoides TaxID=2912268 RepID=A0ABN8UEB2_9BACL|nr:MULTISPECIES: C-terminal binding protein [Paenibacillus]MEB9895020.1 C-terminal binding protein [Bacillus cereus]GIO79017.1 hypothetical protein J6TS7_26270 [Paenibacillus dendritiformis]CAH8249542.1 C-terminal binding protein [Paenibacillus melissococcoides]CAH8721105.1 C-terminal binding protein [Paenibacillus melissococcoides]